MFGVCGLKGEGVGAAPPRRTATLKRHSSQARPCRFCRHTSEQITIRRKNPSPCIYTLHHGNPTAETLNLNLDPACIPEAQQEKRTSSGSGSGSSSSSSSSRSSSSSSSRRRRSSSSSSRSTSRSGSRSSTSSSKIFLSGCGM